MDSTFRNETPWKHEYWNRYRARQRLDDALGRYVPHRSSRSTSTLNSFFSALTPRCAFGRAPNQHGVTVLTVPADRSDALARSRNPEIRILCASFQSPPEGEGGRKNGADGIPVEGISRDLCAFVTSFGRRQDLGGFFVGRNVQPCKEIPPLALDAQGAPIPTHARKQAKSCTKSLER